MLRGADGDAGRAAGVKKMKFIEGRWAHFMCVLLMLVACAGCAHERRNGPVLYQHMLGDLSHWKVEAERPGTISAKDGVMTIDVPGGCTVWFGQELQGPVMIRYEARMVRGTGGGPAGANERV